MASKEAFLRLLQPAHSRNKKDQCFASLLPFFMFRLLGSPYWCIDHSRAKHRQLPVSFTAMTIILMSLAKQKFVVACTDNILCRGCGRCRPCYFSCSCWCHGTGDERHGPFQPGCVITDTGSTNALSFVTLLLLSRNHVISSQVTH